MWSGLVASGERLPDRLAFVTRPVHIKCLLLFGFFSFFARPHETHCLLDGGGALVFERTPLAASDKFVPIGVMTIRLRNSSCPIFPLDNKFLYIKGFYLFATNLTGRGDEFKSH